MQKKTVFLFMALALLTSVNALAQSKAWRIESTEWSPAHEAGYEKFVTRIGEAVAGKVCRTVAKCMSNPAVNPYHSSDPAELRLFADCADLPFFLRGYYAWKNQLPYGFVRSVRPNIAPDDADPKRDIRYTRLGNIVRERFNVINRVDSNGNVDMVNGVDMINHVISNKISSAVFRLGYVGMDADKVFSDFYPIHIDTENVRPGTVVYDPNGHVITIYKVTADGRALYVDAHPDNSLTSGMFDARFARSNPGQGAGFKNWRPLKIVGAKYDKTYGWVGGTMTAAKDADLPGHSLEQFYGTNAAKEWKKSEFVINGEKMNFYDFVRRRLATGPLRIDPIADLKTTVQQLCATAQERVDAVQIAVTAGVHKQAHPDRLPKNIFGADGDWETYASPSRDARLKDSFKQVRDSVENTVVKERRHDGSVIYQGPNLVKELLTVYNNISYDCKITYLNSDNKKVTITLEQLRDRLYGISFDPYMCPELRWGARDQELASCRDDETKRAWYKQERWMRFEHERNTDAYTGYSLDELTGPLTYGATSGKDTDIIGYLMNNLQ
jgi:hypothetical protein